MSRLRWPDSTNSVSEKPGTIHSLYSEDSFALRSRARSTPCGMGGILKENNESTSETVRLSPWARAFVCYSAHFCTSLHALGAGFRAPSGRARVVQWKRSAENRHIQRSC